MDLFGLVSSLGAIVTIHDAYKTLSGMPPLAG
jgi:hypothetical protein